MESDPNLRICAAPGCIERVEAPAWFCPEHWSVVAEPVRRDLLAAWGTTRWEYALVTALCIVGVKTKAMSKKEALAVCRRAEAAWKSKRAVCDEKER